MSGNSCTVVQLSMEIIIQLYFSFTMVQFSKSSCAKYIIARQSLSFSGLIKCQEGSWPADNWSTSYVVMRSE